MALPTDIAVLFETAQLSKLEPLAGIAFAINLAYLNLRRWRYKEQVKRLAGKILIELSAKHSNGSSHQHLPQWNALMYLTDREHRRKKLPLFIRWFHWTFGIELDVILSVIACVAAFIILTLGVAFEIRMFQSLLHLAEYSDAQRTFWFLLLAIAVPVFFIVNGRWLVSRIEEFIGECAEEIATIYENKIDDVKIPKPKLKRTLVRNPDTGLMELRAVEE